MGLPKVSQKNQGLTSYESKATVKKIGKDLEKNLMKNLKIIISRIAFLFFFVGNAFGQSPKYESTYLNCKGKVTYLHEYSSGAIEVKTFDEEEVVTLVTISRSGRIANALKFNGQFYDETYYSHEDQPGKPMMWGQVDFTPEEIRVRRNHSSELPVKNMKLDDIASKSEDAFKINRLTGKYEFRMVREFEFRDGRKGKDTISRVGYCEKKDQKF